MKIPYHVLAFFTGLPLTRPVKEANHVFAIYPRHVAYALVLLGTAFVHTYLTLPLPVKDSVG